MNQINISILSSDAAIINSLGSLQKTEGIFTICGQYGKYENIPLKKHSKPAIFFIDDLSNNQSNLFNFLNVFPDYYSETKAIVYTENLDTAFLKTLLSYDVRSILNKTETPALHLKNKFVETIKLINIGSCCFDNVVSLALKGLIWAKGETENPYLYTLPDNAYNDEAIINAVKLLNLLTGREKQILVLIAEGKPNKKISEILFIEVNTVVQHKDKIVKKLKLTSVNELIRFAAIYRNKIFNL